MPTRYLANLLPVSFLLVLVTLTVFACDLESIEGDRADYVSFDGDAPDGGKLGFARNTVPMVDSLLTIRVLVADTTTGRAGQGLPVSKGVRVAWSVSDGTVLPQISEVGEHGIAVTRWRLGPHALRQEITAQLIRDGQPGASATLTLQNQGGPNGLFPSAPVDMTVLPALIEVEEGGSATLAVTALRDKYRNTWDIGLFDFTATSSDTTVVEIGAGVGQQATVHGLRPGNVILTYHAAGRLTAQYDFRNLSTFALIPVTVRSFPGFPASLDMPSAGGAFACAVANAGTGVTRGAVYCWGDNGADQLGASSLVVLALSNPRPDRPVEGLPAGASVRALASGQAHTCAVLGQGTVYCWGANDFQQLGSTAFLPGASKALLDRSGTASASETGFRDITAGANHTCVLGNSGAVYCWGANDQGQLGIGLAGGSELPGEKVQGLPANVVALSSVGPHANHTCAIAEGGALYCWGAGASGQIGDGARTRRTQATPVSGGLSFRSAATSFNENSGSAYTCGVTTGGALYCWGARPAIPGIVTQPAEVQGGIGPFTEVAAGPVHACVLAFDGKASCFGITTNGVLGNDVDTQGGSFPSLQPVEGDRSYKSLVVGSEFTLGVQTAGSAYAWGYNDKGQLGVRVNVLWSATPAQVMFSTRPL
jgi:alpha-tubulin suppressor-like RCC1 family protein